MDDVVAISDLSHLIPAAQTTALLPDTERMAHLRADHWIGYTRAQTAVAKLEEMLIGPPRLRMPNLLIVGPTNNGKSMIIEKFRRRHRPESTPTQDHQIIPVLVMQMPSDPSLTRFYNMVLSALNAPLRPRARVAELEALVLHLMRTTSVRMLVIDELHNMLAGSTAMQREFLNLIRFLGNELRIPIIGVGTRDAYLAIRSDDQLENRFEPFSLPLWEEDEELLALLASFAAVYPLRRPSELHQPEMARYILERTEGTIGEMARLLSHAAVAAIESGTEAITNRTLTLAKYDSPTERRRAFERRIS
ncbi:hypothetical protein J2847_006631 [Azospirillum agricola]|uniref:TniB family NTP-binding protein n=1 Tax=Azospirillum agricola TaxID=1720247 RepID=UPI001AE20BB2|nr:TniB family NTP-binding protein [Azospirillum agricola]MBP2233294.1 hypothetical protein [Azospirillum agricola]